MKSSITSCLNTGLPCLFVGDFNAHHLSWDSCNEDVFGRDLFSFCSSLSVSVLNSIYSPGAFTFPSANSTIDLALCSDPSLASAMSVLTDSTLISDHYPIAVSIVGSNSPGPVNIAGAYRPRLNLAHADWPAFSQSLNSLATRALSDCRFAVARFPTNPRKAMDELHRIITTCLASATQQSIPQQHSRPNAKHWWRAVPGIPKPCPASAVPVDDIREINHQRLSKNGCQPKPNGNALPRSPRTRPGRITAPKSSIPSPIPSTGNVSMQPPYRSTTMPYRRSPMTNSPSSSEHH